VRQDSQEVKILSKIKDEKKEKVSQMKEEIGEERAEGRKKKQKFYYC